MSKTIEDIKKDLGAILHGKDDTAANKIENLLGLIYRASCALLTEIDPEETIRVQQITNALYDNVYRYTAPTDLKGNKIIDIRPQQGRIRNDKIRQALIQDFDYNKDNQMTKFAIEMNSGVKTLKIDNPNLNQGILIHDTNDITVNGTWAAGGDASNLTRDILHYLTGGASLNFDISGTSGYIENSDMTQIDLSDHEDKSSLFVWVYIPDADLFTSVNLRWGNDSSNYNDRTVTTAHNSSVQDGWNLFRFDWNGATETGTVDAETIDYLRITLNATTDTDYRVDSIISIEGSIYEIVYYSKYLYKNTDGTWQEKPLKDDDTINLDVDSYNLLVNKCAILSAPQIQGEDAVFDINFYREEYNNGVKLYTAQHKSQALLQQSKYYG